jgi:hypothetical protein
MWHSDSTRCKLMDAVEPSGTFRTWPDEHGGYHIAGLLALHEHFISTPQNPVPRFLVIDQPSQVYFPEAWPSIEQTPESGGKTDRSPDIDGVHRIFNALSVFFDAVSTEFQIIVTEHAGSITWDGIPHVHLVANWREGHEEFLIPNAWLQPRDAT